MTATLVVLFIIIAGLVSIIAAIDKDRWATLSTLRMIRRNNAEYEIHIKSLDKKLYMASITIKFLTQALAKKEKEI